MYFLVVLCTQISGFFRVFWGFFGGWDPSEHGIFVFFVGFSGFLVSPGAFRGSVASKIEQKYPKNDQKSGFFGVSV
jgi:hypothetical protein